MTANEIEFFIKNGYVKIPDAFSREIAKEAVDILWKDLNVGKDPTTWTQPVIRLGEYSQEPFVAAANTSVLYNAFDALVGEGRWAPRRSLGSFPIRFPSSIPPVDDGWHIDASFPGEDPSDYFRWRINVSSKGRALLMLFLFSDVSENDAPTRIRRGSHQEVARILQPYGDEGLEFMELAQNLSSTADCEVDLATGTAGTVYLVHPFTVHAAQAHYGQTPKFMAQPPLFPKVPLNITRSDSDFSPVEKAIQQALLAKI